MQHYHVPGRGRRTTVSGTNDTHSYIDFDPNVCLRFCQDGTSPYRAFTPTWAILISYINDLCPCSKMFQCIAIMNYCKVIIC